MLRYTLQPVTHSHEWHITLSFLHTDPGPVVLRLPNWVPGSYMIRDFARHIVQISAECNGRPAPLAQTAKNTWQSQPIAGNWIIRYTVYAYDLSVRASYLTNERGFFDGACLFLAVGGRETERHILDFAHLPTDWQIATTLPTHDEQPNRFQAPTYLDLIDHPVELGKFETLSFTASGIPHRIVLSGHYADFDRHRLCHDIQKICETELAMFPLPAPFHEYLFLLYVGDNIYGGLEHLNSTALHIDRKCLPPRNMSMNVANDDYTQLLALCAHEYFHAWNIKSIKPAAFTPYRLDRENYTEQLWAFEGITSYYDDLILVRSGVISPQAYLNLLAKNLTRVQQGAGRTKQTLAESSFAAWHKYYKQDENSPNAIVSYYQKGALAALCLDLLIRHRSKGKHSLDTVMQQLYLDWKANRTGIAERQWQVRCQEITGLDLNDFFLLALYSTQDLPLQECLATVGIDLQWRDLPRSHGGGLTPRFITTPSATDFGARFKQHADHIILTHVFNHGSAEQAALCPNDKIIAINGFACTDFASQWEQFAVNDTLTLHYFRQGVLQHTQLTVQAALAETALLSISNANLLADWLQYQTH